MSDEKDKSTQRGDYIGPKTSAQIGSRNNFTRTSNSVARSTLIKLIRTQETNNNKEDK